MLIYLSINLCIADKPYLFFVHKWILSILCKNTFQETKNFNYNISIFWPRRTVKKGRYILRSLLNIYFRIIEGLNPWKSSYIFHAVPSPKIQTWIIYIRYLHLRRTMPVSPRQISIPIANISRRFHSILPKS